MTKAFGLQLIINEKIAEATKESNARIKELEDALEWYCERYNTEKINRYDPASSLDTIMCLKHQASAKFKKLLNKEKDGN